MIKKAIDFHGAELTGACYKISRVIVNDSSIWIKNPEHKEGDKKPEMIRKSIYSVRIEFDLYPSAGARRVGTNPPMKAKAETIVLQYDKEPDLSFPALYEECMKQDVFSDSEKA